MDDPRSPQKQEFREILNKWAKVTQGRLTIYDYDQSMLVWRDLPNPSQMAFREDVKHYRDAGILGVNTESRNALATTFINLYLRARLMWNPTEDVDTLLDDFYARFFGPAAGPMKKYWDAIFTAWQDTIVTEHEYFVAPAIYTPDVVEKLGAYLHEAEAAIQQMDARDGHLSRNEQRYLQRMRFIRLGYTVLQSYMSMVRSAATDVDFAAAVDAGERGLRARDELTAMNKRFHDDPLENGYAFWPGEVEQYRELIPFINGEKGTLIAKLPLAMGFSSRSSQKWDGEGVSRYGPIDLSFWNAHGQEFDVNTRKDYPLDQWQMIRTDLYVQAQGVRLPDQQSFVGDLWYRTNVKHFRGRGRRFAAHPFSRPVQQMRIICRWKRGRQAETEGSVVVERLSLRVGRIAGRSGCEPGTMRLPFVVMTRTTWVEYFVGRFSMRRASLCLRERPRVIFIFD